MAKSPILKNSNSTLNFFEKKNVSYSKNLTNVTSLASI
jgi:hypothetical protein